MGAFTDDNGFVVVGSREDWSKTSGVWAEVRKDVAIIRSILERGGRGAARTSQQATARAIGAAVAAAIAAPASRGSDAAARINAAAGARSVGGRGLPSPARTDGRTGGTGGSPRPAPGGNAALQQRDERGRFTARQDAAPEGERGPGGSDAGRSALDLKLAAEALAAVGDQAAGMDPAVAAAKEVGEVVMPVGRLLGKMFGFGAEGKKLRWYQRIWKSLTEINRGVRARPGVAPVPAASGGLLSSLLGLFGGGAGRALGGLGIGAGAAGAAAAAGGVRGLLGRGADAVKSGGRALAAPAAGLLRKLGPLAVLGDLFEGVASDRLIAKNAKYSESEKNDRRLSNIARTGANLGGHLAGGAAGAAIGSILGPVGTVIGGAIGAWFGPAVVKQFADQASPYIGAAVDSIKDVHGKAVDALSEAMSWASEKFKQIKDGATDVFNNVVDSVSHGIEVVAQSRPAQVISSGYNKAVEVTSRGIEAAANAKDWVLGKTSAFFESGKRGVSAISTGNGDLGGKSYGKYQLASGTGTLQKYLKQSPYGQQFAGLAPGSPEFDRKWKALAASDEGFASSQHDFIKATHFDPEMADLKAAGIDLSGRGAALQDAIWSTSVQFGGKASSHIGKALKGMDVAGMSDEQLITAIQDYKIVNNDRLFASSSSAVRAGTLARAEAEKQQLLSLNAQFGAAGRPAPMPPVALPQQGSVPSPPMFSLAAANAGPPSSAQPLVPLQQVGQDMADRRLAHIQTGGIGMS